MVDRDSPARVVVCDAGPLIHLDELASIDLLSDFEEALVPSVVWTEVEAHRPAALQNARECLRRITMSGPLPADLQAIAHLFALQRGELRAIQIARREGADLLLTDDTAARLAAQTLDIAVHGTIGVLVRSIRRQQRSKQEVIGLLRRLPTESTLHLRLSLLEETIRQVEQSA